MIPLSILGSLDGGFLALNAGGSAVLGGLAGYATKKMAKVAAVLMGAQTAFLAFLERQGIISVNWGELSATVQQGTTQTTTVASDVMGTAASTGAMGAGFAGGFAIGFKRA